ncbi:MAG TPA: recombinase family protein [Streptosporangiaceae bacterium]
MEHQQEARAEKSGHQALAVLGVPANRVYLDKGLTGTGRARPGLNQALAAVREGDTLTLTKLDRLDRSVPGALDILSGLPARGVRLALGGSTYHWNDPFSRMFLQILAQDREIRRMHDSGDYNVPDIAVLLSISRPTVHRSPEGTTALPPLAAESPAHPG